MRVVKNNVGTARSSIAKEVPNIFDSDSSVEQDELDMTQTDDTDSVEEGEIIGQGDSMEKGEIIEEVEAIDRDTIIEEAGIEETIEDKEKGREVEKPITGNEENLSTSLVSVSSSAIVVEEEEEKKKALDELENDLYCSICFTPQKTEHFLKHIKEHKENDSMPGWERFTLPVLLPLCYVVERKGYLHGQSSSIKHPELTPDINDPNYFCKTCDRIYYDRGAYNVHLVRVHNISRVGNLSRIVPPFPFPTLFPDPDNEDRYCAPCGKTFTTFASFKTHIKGVHYVGIQQSFDCEICALPFGKSEYLKRHMLNKHNIGRITYVDRKEDCNDEKLGDLDCPSCPEKFLSINSYLKHVDVHYADKSTSPKRVEYAIPNPADSVMFCHACQVYYSERYNFRQHLSKKHNIQSPGYRTANSYNYIRKNSSKPARQKSPAIAATKKRKASDSPDTDYHASISSGLATRQQPKRATLYRVVHSTIMPDPMDELHYCGACEVKFPSRGKFNIHLQSQHKYWEEELQLLLSSFEENDPIYSCPLCHTEVGDRSDFNIHLKTEHHMELAVPASSRDLTCEICEEEFSKKSKLSEHIEDEHPHLNPNPKRRSSPICCFCNLNCFTTPGLGLHKQTVHHISLVYDFTNFYCNLCDRKYSSKTHYLKHIEIHKIGPEKDNSKERKVDLDKESKDELKDKSKKQATTSASASPDVSNPESTVCNVCNLEYSSPTQYRLHRMRYH